MMSAALEALNNLVESTAGKWARRIFPWVATIVLMVLVVNWMELIPGVDSIGLMHGRSKGARPIRSRELFRIGNLPVGTIVRERAHGETPAGSVVRGSCRWCVPPRLTELHGGSGSDLGRHEPGARDPGRWPGYFKKFFNFGGLGRMLFRERLGPFDLLTPFIDIFVGLLELVAEIAKIISFSFRLFGNIFAGSVLLFVIGSLVPVMVQSGSPDPGAVLRPDPGAGLWHPDPGLHDAWRPWRTAQAAGSTTWRDAPGVHAAPRGKCR